MRHAAAELIADAGLNLPSSSQFKTLADFLCELLADSSEEVCAAGLKLFQSKGTLDMVEVVEKAFENASSYTRDKVTQAVEKVQARHDPRQAFSRVLSGECSHVGEVLPIIELVSFDIDKEVLLTATQHQDAKVAAFAARRLADRGELPLDVLPVLLAHPSLDVRRVAFKQAGKSVSEVAGTVSARNLLEVFKDVDSEKRKEIVFDIIRAFPADELSKQLNWFSPDAAEQIYRSLALDYFEANAGRIRDDLNDSFAKFQQRSLDLMGVENEQERDKMVADWAELESWLNARYAAAAFEGLAAHGSKRDAALARRYLKSVPNDYQTIKARVQSLRVLARFGTANDVKMLMRLAQDGNVSGSDVNKAAADAALSLSPSVEGAAGVFLQNKDHDLVQRALKALWTEEVGVVLPHVEPLLRENSWTRHAALFYVARKCTSEQLEQLLVRYREDRYFYDVVCCIDQVLYAPPPLAQFYLRNIKQSVLPEWGPEFLENGEEQS